MKKMNNKGFSLVELIIVIAIMAVLVGVLAPQFLRYVEQSRVQKDESAMGEVNNAVKIACSVSEVYDALTNTTLTYGTADLTDWSTAGAGTQLAAELNKTIPKFSKFASKKYMSSNAVTHIEISGSNGTVEVYTTNAANSTLTIR